MQVALTFYTYSCGYFLSANFAQRVFDHSCSHYLSFYSWESGEAHSECCVRAAGSTAGLCCPGSCARLPRNSEEVTNFARVLLSSCHTWFVEMFPTHTIIHPLCLIQVPLLLQGAKMKNNYIIRSYLNLQESNFEHDQHFYRFGGSDPSGNSVIQLNNAAASSFCNWVAPCLYLQRLFRNLSSHLISLWEVF